ncbi:MAG: hypothetical protein ACFFDC_20480 [Promethearchaeota archaeon]
MKQLEALFALLKSTPFFEEFLSIPKSLNMIELLLGFMILELLIISIFVLKYLSKMNKILEFQKKYLFTIGKLQQENNHLHQKNFIHQR